MKPPRVKKFLSGPFGTSCQVERIDGSEISCELVINDDGTLGLKPPRGEWLVEPPSKQLEGQATFEDTGDCDLATSPGCHP